MELQIYNGTDKVSAIEWNFADLKEEITLKANDYKSLVYTDETIKDAKEDRATLNKFIKALNDKRKEVKAEVTKPYTIFEGQVKELIEIIRDANGNIDRQVKEYEEACRATKLEKVKEIYQELIGNTVFADIIPFAKAYKETYCNASTTVKSIKDEMEALLCKVQEDLHILNADRGEYQFDAKEEYLKNFDMSAALRVKQQYEDRARRKAEYEKQLAAEKQKAAEEESKAVEVVATAGKEIVEKQVEAAEEKQAIKLTKTICFKVEATAEQLHMLKEFLLANNIKYGPVQ